MNLAAAQGKWFGRSLSGGEPAFLDEHRIVGTPVMPAAAMLEWAYAAACATDPEGGRERTLHNATFNAFLAFPEDRSLSVQAAVEAHPEAGHRVRLFSQERATDPWTEHATLPQVCPAPARPEPTDLDAVRSRMTAVPTDGFYERLWRAGVEYGPGFQGLRELLRDGDEALALVEVREEDSGGGGYTLHPVVLDACFHVVAAFTEGEHILRLPTSVDRLDVYARLSGRIRCHARWHGVDESGECALDLDLLTETGERLATVERLRFRTVSPAALSGLAATKPRRYEIEWRSLSARPLAEEQAADPAEGADEDGTWLVFDADGGRRAEDDRVTEFLGLGLTALLMDGEDETEFAHALAKLRSEDTPVAGLLLDGAAEAGEDTEGGEEARADDGSGDGSGGGASSEDVYARSRRVFTFLKVFLREFGPANPRIVLRSRGAVAGEPRAAVLTAAAKAVVAEYPALPCVQVDAAPDATPPALHEVLRRAATLGGAGHLAVGADGGWREARLREHVLAASGGGAAVPVRPDAAYLVTGGMRGIGPAVAKWLADRGARELLLVGRAVPDELPAEVEELRARGVRVELRPADVSLAEDVDALFAYAREEMAPLRGVVHLAGTTSDALLEEAEWDRFRTVLDPKVRGAWRLHERCGGALADGGDGTDGIDVDFFLLFSSMTAMTGSAGQSSYVLANSLLDALAAHRRQRGLPALSVGWGAWGEVGMAAHGAVAERMAAAGVDAMPPEQALDALARLPLAPSPHVGLARMDWRRYALAVPRPVPYSLLDEVRPAGVGDATGAAAPARLPSVDELAELVLRDPDLAHETVLGGLLEAVGMLLAMDAGGIEELRPRFGDTRLNLLGLDSLSTVRLRARLLSDFGADVPPDFLFGGGTAREITELICRQLTLRSLVGDADEVGETDDDPDATEVLTL